MKYLEFLAKVYSTIAVSLLVQCIVKCHHSGTSLLSSHTVSFFYIFLSEMPLSISQLYLSHHRFWSQIHPHWFSSYFISLRWILFLYAKSKVRPRPHYGDQHTSLVVLVIGRSRRRNSAKNCGISWISWKNGTKQVRRGRLAKVANHIQRAVPAKHCCLVVAVYNSAITYACLQYCRYVPILTVGCDLFFCPCNVHLW